jgi:hypothetical protein
LTGEEIRGCWEAWPSTMVQTTVPVTIAPARSDQDAHPPLAFVEVVPVQASELGAAPADEVEVPTAAATVPPEPGWSLWGDPEA